ncbi:MFS transporter [Paenibacillus daejeonensis]|uniref:MFS transporter n=1 Tax=Paenibacillus daejeonensis TaxID=135193 RepID=UPI00037EE02F|nr:MFS transporter [Paenibacillus daejeonensis]
MNDKSKATASPAARTADGNGGSTGQPGKAIVYLLGCLLLFSVMNVTVFNVALPDISGDLGISSGLAGWVITGYAMVYAIGALMYGKLADLFPLKRLMTIGIILFSVGSLIGFLSEGFAWLLIGRLVQSAGASSIPALAMLIPARYFAPERRGAVMGLIASFIALSAGIGPIVGGFVTGALHWKYLFLLSLGTLVVLPFLRRALPDEGRRPGTIDTFGAGLLAGAVAMLMLTITNIGNLQAVIYGAIFAVLLLLFILRSQRVKEPFIALSLFTEGPYRYAILAMFLSSMTAFSLMLLVPLMLESMFGFGAQGIGMVLFPAAIAAAFMGRLGGRWTDRFGSIPILLMAATLMITGFVLMAGFAWTGPWMIAIALILPNIGFVFVQSSMSKLVSLLLPAQRLGAGMGVFSMTNFMSGAIGGALATTALDWGVPFPAIFLTMTFLLAMQMLVVQFILRGKVSGSGSGKLVTTSSKR